MHAAMFVFATFDGKIQQVTTNVSDVLVRFLYASYSQHLGNYRYVHASNAYSAQYTAKSSSVDSILKSLTTQWRHKLP